MDKKAISEHLINALNKEDIHTREAAKFLNLNPCYVSMARNENSWDAMGKASWTRLEEWHLTRDKISQFNIPEGEEIWKPKEKSPDASKKDVIKHKKQKETGNVPKMEDPPPPPVIKSPGVEPTKILGPKNEAPFQVEEITPPAKTYFTDTARLKVALDIEINLVVNGQKIRLA
jgi:hypothetical protein